jgi:hypothetical protein
MILKEQLEEFEKKLPGIKDSLEPWNSNFEDGSHLNQHPQDIKYLETEKYKIAAAKWERHFWTEHSGGGVGWIEWLNIYWISKENRGRLKEYTQGHITTRDEYYPYKDKRDLWGYDKIGLEKLSEDEIEAYWTNEQGKKGPSCKLKLE